MIDASKLIEVDVALEELGVKSQLERLENVKIWTPKGVRTINGQAPDDQGDITVSVPAGGVTSVAGTTNQILVNGGVTAQTGAVTLSLPTNVLIDGYFHAAASSDLTAGQQTILQAGDSNFTWQMNSVVDGGTIGQATTLNTSFLASELGIVGNAGLDNRVPYYIDDGFGNSVLTTSANLTFSGTSLVVTGTTVSSNYQVLMGQPDWDYAIPYFIPIGGTNDLMSRSLDMRFLSGHLTLGGYVNIAPSFDLTDAGLELLRFGSDPSVNLGGNPIQIRWTGATPALPGDPSYSIIFDDGNQYPVHLKTFGDVTASTFKGNHELSGSGTGDVWFSDASDYATRSAAFNYTTATGQLALSTTGSGAGLLIGGDTQLYRSAADILRTPDSLQVDTAFAVNTTPSTTTIFQTNYAPGTYSAGTTTSHSFSASAQGNASGNSNHRTLTFSATMSGSNNFALLTAFQGDVNKNNSGTGELRVFSANLRFNGSGNSASGYGYENISVLTSTGNVTLTRSFNARTPTLSSTGVITTNVGYNIENQGVTGITTAIGINIAAQSGATNNYSIASAAGNVHGFGTTTPGANVHTAGALSRASWTTSGLAVRAEAATYTDTSTAAAGTAASAVGSSFGIVTLAATNAITVTDGSTVYISGAAAAGTNVTLTRGWSFWIDAGNARFDGNIDFSVSDTSNLVLGTGTGTKFGTATSQKLAFFNSTPIIQPINTVAINDVLVNLGLRASGGVSNFTTNVDVSTVNIVTDTTTGTKIGTATTQKLGFFNATPITQPSGDVVTALQNLGLLTSGTVLATTITARTLWGQTYDGSANVTGSLTAVGDITGGASSMIITAGTGNSRTMTLRSTTAGGTATAFITGNADQTTTFGAAIKPPSNDGAAIGVASTAEWSDLFLAEGGVINWDNGDVTITQTGNVLAFAGAATRYQFDANITPASSDGAALGTSALMFSDVFLASGAVVNFNNGDVTLTHSTDVLTFAGGTFDFGTATALVIPNGAGGTTVDATGEVTVDSTSRTFNFYDGTAEVVLDPEEGKSYYLASPTSADDLPIFRFNKAVTLTKVVYAITGGTNWVGQLQEADDAQGTGAADTQAADSTVTGNTTVTSFSNASFDAGDYIRVKTTSVSGTVTWLHITFYFRTNP